MRKATVICFERDVWMKILHKHKHRPRIIMCNSTYGVITAGCIAFLPVKEVTASPHAGVARGMSLWTPGSWGCP